MLVGTRIVVWPAAPAERGQVKRPGLLGNQQGHQEGAPEQYLQCHFSDLLSPSLDSED